MRIQYVSDIHLEFGPFELPKTDADVVVAAGDIGAGTNGLSWLGFTDCPVIYVAGNHEYYGGDLVYTLSRLRSEALHTHVSFLENDSVVIGNVRFLGTTLWTDFGGANAEMMEFAALSMNDYYCIRCDDKPLTAEHTLRLNEEARQWLEETLNEPFSGKTVVVTHHAPSYQSWHGAPDSPIKDSYCSDFVDLVGRYPIDLWIHGHIHCVSDYTCNGVRIVCNPRGYTGYQIVEHFDAARTIDI
ncbi:MAG: metallophosphoesterase [Gammaproteobacteria bacterium]|nr:metallophosphoesterase [Gammaproteobacteria bacterium]MCI0590719.1 metallophosphoesterase [Gammaproteobacteria bacterium]